MLITLLIGLPGSGKSWLGEQMDGVFIDDASQNPNYSAIAYLSNAVINKRRVKFADEKMDLVIADPHFCYPKHLAKAKTKLAAMFPGYTIECIYFENDPEKCHRNVKRRDDGRKVGGLIEMVSKAYVIPEGVIPREIWDG